VRARDELMLMEVREAMTETIKIRVEGEMDIL
jgi:hypothetical protein